MIRLYTNENVSCAILGAFMQFLTGARSPMMRNESSWQC